MKKPIMVSVLLGGGDKIAPTVTITSTESSPTAVLPIPVTFTLSEPSTDFAVGDLTLGVGSSVANFAGSGVSYTCELTPPINGTATIDIAAGAFHDAAGNGNTAATQFSIISSAFVLADDYNDTVAAGAVNGTAATPSGNARVAIDANSKLSIGSGKANFATGGAADGEPLIRYEGVVRVAGKAVIGEMTNATNRGYIGWNDGAVAGEPTHSHTFRLFTNEIRIYIGANTPVVGSKTGATSYLYAIVLRATGAHYFIKGGTEFPVWTLLYNTKDITTTPMYPFISNTAGTGVFTSDTLRVPTDLIVITPLASDAFTRVNGELGTTGGGGSAESGGSGLAWATQKGTAAIATNKAVFSALTDSLGIATVPCGTPDVMVEVVATRAAGTSGLCLRYTDADNYIKAVHNGTNLQVIEVVAGTPNTLINAAATYGAAFRLFVSLKSTKVRAYYNDALIGAEATTVIGTGNNHGLFTDDTGATFDNFVVWAKGNGGEYAVIQNYANP